MDEFLFLVEKSEAGTRLDKFLIVKMPEFSRAKIQKLIDENLIKVNEKNQPKKYILKAGETVEMHLPEAEPCALLPEDIPLEVIFEDEDLLVINKPKGMVVHPAAGHRCGTLVNALLHHCGADLSGINGIARPGIVHRIDKDTSGLLVVAKNDFSHNFLAAQIKSHGFKREYEAVIHGNLKDKKGTIITNIGRHKTDRKKMAPLTISGKRAITHYEVIEEFEKFAHLKLMLETGRTHQIRVHLAFMGHPVLGDEVYSSRKNEFDFLKGQCLHARTIGFIHPKTQKNMEFQSDLPEYFLKILGYVKC